MLRVEGLRAGYGAGEVLRGVDLAVGAGEVVAVLGANGCGKSTLLRALAGVLPCRGAVRWGCDGVGYMPQDNAPRAGLSAFEVVLLGRLRSLAFRVGAADLAAAEAAMVETGCAGLAGRRLGELSGGQRQLVFLAQVLAGGPQALLLDEPTSALDIAHQLQVLELLGEASRRRGLTTIAALHDLNAAARFGDRLVLLHDGRVLADGAASDVLRPDLLAVAYGVEAAVVEGPDGRPVVVPLRARR